MVSISSACRQNARPLVRCIKKLHPNIIPPAIRNEDIIAIYVLSITQNGNISKAHVPIYAMPVATPALIAYLFSYVFSAR